MVAVIRGYKIGKTIMEGNRAIIPVTYDVVGIVNGGVFWEPYSTESESSKSMEDIRANYELRRINGQWKIHRPQLMPHISINVALKHHESLLPGPSGDPQIQKDMKKVVDILRKLARGK
jgi:hypothetical protein